MTYAISECHYNEYAGDKAIFIPIDQHRQEQASQNNTETHLPAHNGRELPGVLNFRRTDGHRFPALAVMAGRWLPTPPTSAAPERVFSRWECFLDRLSASELPEKMAVAIFLHCNPTMIPYSRATEEAYFSKFGLPEHEGEVSQ